MAKVIVDVREPYEYAYGHVAGALNIPLSQIVTSALTGVAKDDELILYCNSGNRSGVAQQILASRGYKKVTNGINQRTIESSNF